MKKVSLKNLVWKEGKYYVAQCLNVDVSSFGDTKKTALANLNEALALYFEDSSKVNINKVERPEIVSGRLAYA
jgi:predicted RNase H-like HicB family nuclease